MPSTTSTQPALDTALLDGIAQRAFAQMNRMVWDANHQEGKRRGDPKIGGHPASCASSLHILAALHLAVREPEDYVCCKPHAAPMDHALMHQLRLFRRGHDDWYTDEEAKSAMASLRRFPGAEAPDVFQSYHARTDGDSFHFLPSGSVGIPPVASVYLALAHRYMADHGDPVPEGAHFWSLIGDSEFREGSLLEAMPDAAERLLGNVTWIIDYNRQNLDGTRIPNEKGMHARDCDRIELTARANGWKVIHLRHGAFREELFAREGGDALRALLEDELSDYEYQLALFKSDPAIMRALVRQHSPRANEICAQLSDEEIVHFFEDVAGHNMDLLIAALRKAKTEPHEPYLLIVHTIKGWGMECAADPSNHSSLPKKEEVLQLLAGADCTAEDPYAHFAAGTPEAEYLEQRSNRFKEKMLELDRARDAGLAELKSSIDAVGGLPDSLEVDTSLYPEVHTQWMWGQLAAKLVRISTVGGEGPAMGGTEKELTENEKRWSTVADFILTMSPDVGTSTNIAPVLDRRVYGPESDTDPEDAEFQARHPEMMSHSADWTRHIRFEIAEANCMSAAGSFGKMGFFAGQPSLPIMTVYDFFIKRALDQLYYNLYWDAGFIILGTPSGIALSPEGAQHSWKSDIQIPNLVTWEPFFALEVDWILCDAIRRHMTRDNTGRTGVLIRGVTRSIQQKVLLENLGRAASHKAALPAGTELKPAGTGAEWGGAVDESTLAPRSTEDILAATREDCLAGAYYLVDWRGYAGYEPGDNVVHLFTMGAPSTETVDASALLLERGIFANVIVVSSPELLLGILAEEDDYRHLREGLEISGDLHAVTGAGESLGALVSIAGRRVPIVAICDGEAGLVDNIGSIVGVKQITLAVRKFSKCGRPDQVFRYQDLHADAIVAAAGRALSETALEDLRVAPALLARLAAGQDAKKHADWRELWPAAGEQA